MRDGKRLCIVIVNDNFFQEAACLLVEAGHDVVYSLYHTKEEATRKRQPPNEPDIDFRPWEEVSAPEFLVQVDAIIMDGKLNWWDSVHRRILSGLELVKDLRGPLQFTGLILAGSGDSEMNEQMRANGALQGVSADYFDIARQLARLLGEHAAQSTPTT